MSQQIGEDNGSPDAALLMSAASGDAEGVPCPVRRWLVSPDLVGVVAHGRLPPG